MSNKIFFQYSVEPRLLLSIVLVIVIFSQIIDCHLTSQEMEEFKNFEEKNNFVATFCGCHELNSLKDFG